MTKRVPASQHSPNLGRVGGDVLVQFNERRKVQIRQAILIGGAAVLIVAAAVWMMVATSGNEVESEVEVPLHLEHIANDTSIVTPNLDGLKNLTYSNVPIMRERAIGRIERAADLDREGIFIRTRNRRDLKLEALERSYRAAVETVSDQSARNDLYNRYRAGQIAAENEFRTHRSRVTNLISKKTNELKASVTTPPESSNP